jgi:hypothetical protein
VKGLKPTLQNISYEEEGKILAGTGEKVKEGEETKGAVAS